MTTATVIDYDLGNLPSVIKALERVGVRTRTITTGDDLDDAADAVVLPGVGHFGAGARNLADRGFVEPLRAWAREGKAMLGICVGLQLFMQRSEEDPGAEGLGLIAGDVVRLSAPTVPHMGWNTVSTTPRARVADAITPDEMAYFVHSYAVSPTEDVTSATTEHGTTFCSAVERDRLVGVQFHPEKSGDVGRRVLERFFERCA